VRTSSLMRSIDRGSPSSASMRSSVPWPSKKWPTRELTTLVPVLLTMVPT